MSTFLKQLARALVIIIVINAAALLLSYLIGEPFNDAKLSILTAFVAVGVAVRGN